MKIEERIDMYIGEGISKRDVKTGFVYYEVYPQTQAVRQYTVKEIQGDVITGVESYIVWNPVDGKQLGGKGPSKPSSKKDATVNNAWFKKFFDNENEAIKYAQKQYDSLGSTLDKTFAVKKRGAKKAVKFPTINFGQLGKIKKVFKGIMDFGAKTIDKNSLTIEPNFSRDLEMAKSFKLVTTTTKPPKGTYGYENLKDEERVIVYPTKLGLQLMKVLQTRKELRTDKKIKP